MAAGPHASLRQSLALVVLFVLCTVGAFDARSVLGHGALKDDSTMLKDSILFSSKINTDQRGPLSPPQKRKRQDFSTDVDTMINNWLGCASTPSTAVAISVVQDDALIYAKGYGSTSNGAVDADSLFNIGSCSKAFTGGLAAMLSSEGKLGLSTPVKQYVPSFESFDPVATQLASVRDMLSHRACSAGFNGLWSDMVLDSREKLFQSLAYVPTLCTFRDTYNYNNLMFCAAAYVMEQIEGKSWEQMLQERILDPLQMSSTTADLNEAINSGNYVPAVAFGNGGVKVEYPATVNQRLRDIGPAGSIISSANDMAHWMSALMNDGTWNGQQMLVDPNLFKAITPLPESIAVSGVLNNGVSVFLHSYALGWSVGSYRGDLFFWHAGGAIHTTGLFLVPARKIGVMITTNADGLPALEMPVWVYDQVAGFANWFNPSTCQKREAPQQEQQEVQWKQAPNARRQIPDPTQFVGNYSHPSGSTVYFSHVSGNDFLFNWGKIEADVEWQQGDLFVIRVMRSPLFVGGSANVNIALSFLRDSQDRPYLDITVESGFPAWTHRKYPDDATGTASTTSSTESSPTSSSSGTEVPTSTTCVCESEQSGADKGFSFMGLWNM